MGTETSHGEAPAAEAPASHAAGATGATGAAGGAGRATTASPPGDRPPGTTRDAFLGEALWLLQPARGYRAGIDAVFLAAAAQPYEGQPGLAILDAGAGAGAVGLLAAWRLSKVAQTRVTLLEKAPELASLAERNARDNGLAGLAETVCADFLAPDAELRRGGLVRESFDLVLSNPPYHAASRGTVSADALKAGSHAMPEDGLERWARAMARYARPGGQVVMVHKAQALAEVLTVLSPRFGNLVVLPLHPRQGEPASRILIRGTKGSRAPLSLRPGFVLHADGNAFTPAATAILRDGAGLWL